MPCFFLPVEWETEDSVSLPVCIAGAVEFEAFLSASSLISSSVLFCCFFFKSKKALRLRSTKPASLASFDIAKDLAQALKVESGLAFVFSSSVVEMEL